MWTLLVVFIASMAPEVSVFQLACARFLYYIFHGTTTVGLRLSDARTSVRSALDSCVCDTFLAAGKVSIAPDPTNRCHILGPALAWTLSRHNSAICMLRYFLLLSHAPNFLHADTDEVLILSPFALLGCLAFPLTVLTVLAVELGSIVLGQRVQAHT
jgi:hypothetical protein